jgi:branched-chain amino acid transport system permease protein
VQAPCLAPLLGAAVWLYLSDFFQTTLHLGATWKLVLGIVFVLLVCFLRRGVIGGLGDLVALCTRRRHAEPREATPAPEVKPLASLGRSRRHDEKPFSGPALEARGLTKKFGGLVANGDIDFAVSQGELRGIIGPNGAGKSTFFKMLTCEMRPTSGRILFHGRDITGMDVARVCRLGLTKSYQVNQLFTRQTLRENIVIAAAERRGSFSLDLLRRIDRVPGLDMQVEAALAMVGLAARADVPVAELAYDEKRRLEIGLALASSPSLLLLDEPLAGMSPRERRETVQLLKNLRRGRTLVIVEHDMDAVFELAERITVLHEGALLAEGTPAEIQRNRLVQEAYLGGVAAA